MDRLQLVELLGQFRENYLSTTEGAEEIQKRYQESKAIRERYAQIRSKLEKQEDITDDVLDRLLPHINTKFNRERGAHISVWSSIRHDIRPWFQSVKYKKPEDWPATAIWILDIVDVGASLNWHRWDELATHPLQRGFACGLLTPIIHCLNQALPVISSKVVRAYKLFNSCLGINDTISTDLREYPLNAEKVRSLVTQLHQFGIPDLITWDLLCHWYVVKYSVIKENGCGLSDIPSCTSSGLDDSLESDELIRELTQAQYDTNHPMRFEKALAQAFAYLGFQVEQIGGAGNPDVFAQALLGENSYSIVVDAKTCQPGVAKTKTGIDYLAVRKHQQDMSADFAVIVAAKFAYGDTISNAEQLGLILLETNVLMSWLRQHSACGLSPYTIRRWLSQQSGLLKADGREIVQQWEHELKLIVTVLRVFEEHQLYDLSAGALSEKEIVMVLKVKYPNLSISNTSKILSLLSHPILGILQPDLDGYLLTISVETAFRRLLAFAREITRIRMP